MLKNNELLNYIKIDVVDSQCSADLIVNNFIIDGKPLIEQIDLLKYNY